MAWAYISAVFMSLAGMSAGLVFTFASGGFLKVGLRNRRVMSFVASRACGVFGWSRTINSNNRHALTRFASGNSMIRSDRPTGTE